MTMILESGAIVDPSELAATDYTRPPEEILEPSLEDAVALIESTDTAAFNQEESSDDFPAIDELNVSLSGSLEQLRSVRDEVMRSGQISRSEAAMIKNLLASTESLSSAFDNLPVNSFTEMGSRVNLNTTCESLLGSIYQVILKIIRAVTEYIKNIGKWIYKVSTSRAGKTTQFDAVDKAVSKKLESLSPGDALQKKSDHIQQTYGPKWSEMDEKMIRFRPGNDTIELMAIVDAFRGVDIFVNKIAHNAKTANNTTLINTNYVVPFAGGHMVAIGSGGPDSMEKKAEAFKTIFEDFMKMNMSSAKTPLGDAEIEYIRLNKPMTFKDFQVYHDLSRTVSDVAEKTQTTIKLSIEKNATATDEWLENRRDVANLLKWAVLATIHFTNVINQVLVSRDKISRLRLDLAK